MFQGLFTHNRASGWDHVLSSPRAFIEYLSQGSCVPFCTQEFFKVVEKTDECSFSGCLPEYQKCFISAPEPQSFSSQQISVKFPKCFLLINFTPNGFFSLFSGDLHSCPFPPSPASTLPFQIPPPRLATLLQFPYFLLATGKQTGPHNPQGIFCKHLGKSE